MGECDDKLEGVNFWGRDGWVDLDHLVRSQGVTISVATISTTKCLWSASDFSDV